MSVQIEGVVDYVQYPKFFTKPMEWAVVHIKTPTGKVKAVGEIVPCKRGEVFLFDGEYNNDPKHGKRFKFTQAHRSDQGESGASSYLAHLFGPKTAEKIVKFFGSAEVALQTFKTRPMDLTQVKGISAKTVKKGEKKHEHHQVAEVLFTTLRPYGISMHMALKIYKKHGVDALDVIRENPYILMEEFESFGFNACDLLSTYFNISLTNKNRIQAGIMYTVKRAMSDGHSYILESELQQKATKLLSERGKVPQVYVAQELISMIKGEKLVLDGNVRVYFPPYIKYEREIAKNALRLRGVRKVDQSAVLCDIQEYARQNGIKLAQKQVVAIQQAMGNRLSIVTGPPGAGKTTIINGVKDIFRKWFRLEYGMEPAIGLAAPTGKAARRMREATLWDAYTLHKLLQFRPDPATGRWEFEYNARNPMPYDLLVIDEFSMVDLPLAHHFFQAVKKGAVVVLVGDRDQLKSVGAGRVLADMMESEKFPVTVLDENFRTKKSGNNLPSTVLPRAFALRDGVVPNLDDAHDFRFFEHDDMLTLQEEIVKSYYDAMLTHGQDEVVILSPMRKTELGVEELNKMLQAEINPPSPGKKEVKFGRVTFREGDKVMQKTPNEQYGLVNGQVGYITHYIPEDPQTDEDELLLVDYDGETKEYTRDRFDELTHAWATTVHKSQGSEWKVVLMPIVPEHKFMHDKSLIYTAWTRYKTKLECFGDKKAIEVAVHKEERVRNSMLKERIKQGA